VNTENTEIIKEWVFYDGECTVCQGFANRLAGRLQRQGVGVASLQAKWVRERLHLGSGETINEMKLVTGRGETLGGVEALIYLARYFWWGWGLRLLARLPGGRIVLRQAYAGFAGRRNCLKRGCRI
jgi:predicted DCC family thiol-disulfide oxidoreductase YuxK